MVDQILSPDLLRALDRFINGQHPSLSRYDALKLAFRDWAIGHGYLDVPLNKSEVFPRGRRISVSRAVRTTAGAMLDRFIADHPSKDHKPPD